MKNKYFLSTFFILICFPFICTSCSNQKPLKPDTPINTAIVMEGSLKAGNYESFNELFADGRKNTVSAGQFNELKKLTTDGTDFKHYELLTFSNGKMILITLTQNKIDSKYKIEDVKEVSDEMKALFK